VGGVEDVRVRDDELLALMLGLYRVGGPACPIREVRRGERGVLLEASRGEETVYLLHAAGTLVLERLVVVGPGRKAREIAFSDVRSISGRPRPWTMTYSDAESDLELRVEVRDERIDEEIGEGVFGPAEGRGGGPRGRPERFDNPGG
jgi:hypothetical protein